MTKKKQDDQAQASDVQAETDEEVLELELNDDVPADVAEGLGNGMDFEWADPRKVAQHALNWKQHPSIQREGYRELHDEVGWAGALLFNRQTNRLLDGHMRLQDALENNMPVVPMLTIDVPEEKELLILEYLDLVGSLFKRKQSAIDKLEEINQTRSALLRRIAQGEAALDEDEEELEDEDGLVIPDASDLPEGGLSLVLGEQYNYIVLMFQNDLDWTAAQDHFGLKKVRCVFNSGVGLGRVVDGSAYLENIYQNKLGIEKKPSAANALRRKGSLLEGLQRKKTQKDGQ